MKLLSATLLFLLSLSASAQTKYQKDFDEFCRNIDQHYAYMQQQGIDWKKSKAIYQQRAATITDNTAFIRLLENMLNELHNGHSSLNTNLATSNRLIPSGQDMYVEKVNGKYYITDLRPGYGAAICGLKTGIEITAFNGKDIDSQIRRFLPQYTDKPAPQMYQYAINMLFAGTHDTKRKITIKENGNEKVFQPDQFDTQPDNRLLDYKIMNRRTAYIRIKNSLGNNDLISEFDNLLDSLMPYQNIVLDLTETPGGGNTTVARAIMGRFTDTLIPYQVHEYGEKEYNTKRHWVEYVLPRGNIFQGNVYILVGRWTGSMGEGMAMGFDKIKNATVIGTKMAGLLGAISGFTLSETKIGYQFPTERLYHVDGRSREDFIPRVRTQDMPETIKKAATIR